MDSADVLLVLKAVDQATRVITGVGGSIDNLATRSGARMTALGAQMTSAVTVPIIGIGAAAAKTAFDFEKQATAASRALNLSGTQVTAFKNDVLDLAPKLGILPTTFAELATEAGKLGVQRSLVLSFAETIQKVAVATDTSTIELTKQGAAIQAVYGGGRKELEKFFAAVNQLDDSVGGSASTITDFVQRTAGIGKVAGFNTQQLAALGATFNKLGFDSERAARASNSLITKLSAVNVLSPKSKKTLERYGISVRDLAESMAKDPQQGLIGFLEKVRTLSTAGRLEVLKATAGADFAPLFAALSGSMGEYQRALKLAGGDQANLNKLNSEFAKQQQSTAGQVMIFQATMQKLGIVLGAAILPAVNAILQKVTPLVDQFARFAQANPGIVQTGIAIAGVLAIVAPAVWIIGSIIGVLGTLGGALTGVTKILGLAKIAGTALGAVFAFIAANPIVLVMIAIGALIGATVALYQRWEPFRTFVNNLWAGVVRAFQWGVGQVKANLDLIPQFFSNLAASGGNFGFALITTFIQGIYRALPNLGATLQQVMAWVRGFFPSSPAKRGALADLDSTGAALVNTFAGGIDPSLVTGAMNELASASSPGTNAAGTINNTTNQGGSKTINVYFQPTIQGGGNSNIIEQLRPYAQELVTLLSETDARMSRANF